MASSAAGGICMLAKYYGSFPPVLEQLHKGSLNIQRDGHDALPFVL